MAITPVSAFTPLTGTAQTSRVSGSFTPVAGELLVIACTARDNAAAVTPVLTLTHSFAGTWSFTKETNDLTAQFNAHSIWYAIVPSGAGAGTVTVTADRSCARWRLIGVRFAGSNGDSPPTNRRANFTTAAAAPSTTVPSALVGTSSCLVGIISSQGNVAPSINPGSGFTELLEAGDASATIEQVEYNSAPTSTTVDWSGCGTTGSRPHVFEVKAAASLTTVSQTLTVQRSIVRLSPLSDPVQLFPPFSSGAASSNVSPAFTPNAGDLILIAASARQNIGTDPVPDFTISNTHAGVWNWTKYQQEQVGTPTPVIAVFAAICPASPGSGTVTVSTGAAVPIRWSMMGDAISGGAMVPWNWSGANTLSGGLFLDLPNTPKLTSLQVGYIWANLQNPVITAGTGWTEVRETGGSVAATLEMQFRRSNVSPTVSWADASSATQTLAIGIEIPIFAVQTLTQDVWTNTPASQTSSPFTPHPGRYHVVAVTTRDSGSATAPVLAISNTHPGTWSWQSLGVAGQAQQHRTELFYALAPAGSAVPGTVTVSITNGLTGSRWRMITCVIEDDVGAPVNTASGISSSASPSVNFASVPRQESWEVSAVSSGSDTDGVTCVDQQVGQVGGAVQITTLAVQARGRSVNQAISFTGCNTLANCNALIGFEFPPLVVSKTLDVRRATTVVISKTLDIRRALAAGLNPVSSALDIRRAVTTSVSKTLDIRRTITAPVSKTLTVQRPISVYMTSTVTIRRAVNVIVSKTVDIRRAVNVVVSKTLDTRRALNVIVSKTLDVRRAVTIIVSKTLTVQRAVTITASKTLTVQRAITGPLIARLDIRRGVTVFISKTLTVQRALTGTVLKTLTVQRAVTGRIGKDLTVQRAVSARITRTLDIRRQTVSLTPAVPIIAFAPVFNGNATAINTGNFSVQVGDVVFIDISARQNTGSDQVPNFAITGNTFAGTWSWTRVQQVGLGSPSPVLARFMAVAPTGSDAAPGTVTISAQITAGLNPIRWKMLGALWRGGAASVPNNNASGTDGTATPTATLPTAPAGNSATFAVEWTNLVGPTLNPGTGYNELQEAADAVATSLQQEYHCGSPPQTASWSGAGTNSIWIISEIPGAATTVVSKTLDIRRALNVVASKTLTVQRSIQTTIVKTLTVQRTVNIVVSKTLTVQRAVTATVLKTLTVVRAVTTILSRTLTVVRDVRGAVIKPLTLSRAIINQVARTLDVRRSIINQVIRPVTLTRDIIRTLSKTLTLQRVVYLPASKTLTVQRSIIRQVIKPLDIRRTILTLSGVNNALTVRRAVNVFVARTLTVQRSINVVVSKTLTVRRAANIIVSKTLDVRRSVTVFVARTLDIRRSTGTRLTANLTVARAVVAVIARPLTITRDIIARTARTFTLSRSVAVVVAQPLTIRRSVTTIVTRPLQVVRAVNIFVSRAFTLRRQVTVFISSQVTIWRYIVGQVTTNLTIQRQVTRAMTSTVDIRRAIIARTSATLTVSRSVNKFVSQTLTVRRSVTVFISKTLTVLRAVTILATKTLTLSRSAVGPLAGRLTIQRGVSVIVSSTLTLRRAITFSASRTLIIQRTVLQAAIRGLTIQRSIVGRITRNLRIIRDISVVTKSTLTMRRSVTLLALRNLTIVRKMGESLIRTLTLRRPLLMEMFGHLMLRRTVGSVVTRELTIRRTIGSVAESGGIRIDHVFTGELIIKPLRGTVTRKVLGDDITVPHTVRAKVGR